MQAQPTNETEVLPIALAPAQIALDEIGEGRRILLEAARSSGSTRTSQPARRISTASTWSWLSTRPPSGGGPGRVGSRQWSP